MARKVASMGGVQVGRSSNSPGWPRMPFVGTTGRLATRSAAASTLRLAIRGLLDMGVDPPTGLRDIRFSPRPTGSPHHHQALIPQGKPRVTCYRGRIA